MGLFQRVSTHGKTHGNPGRFIEVNHHDKERGPSPGRVFLYFYFMIDRIQNRWYK